LDCHSDFRVDALHVFVSASPLPRLLLFFESRSGAIPRRPPGKADDRDADRQQQSRICRAP